MSIPRDVADLVVDAVATKPVIPEISSIIPETSTGTVTRYVHPEVMTVTHL